MATVSGGGGLTPSDGSIAVTGASGFIGSHVTKALLAAGYTVVAVVRDATNATKTAHLRALTSDASKIEFRSGDLLVPHSYDSAFAGCVGVVHCAAVVSNANAVKDPQRDIVDPSVIGCKNVADSVAAQGGAIKRLVQTSSVAAIQTYDKEEGYVFSESDWNDWSSLERGDPYGVAKTEAERLMAKRATQDGFEVTFINPSVVFGTCLTKAHSKASPVFVRQLLFGNTQPDISFSFVDVEDVAAAHVAAVSLPTAAVSGRRFILSGDDATNWTRLPALATRLSSSFPGLVATAPLHAGFFFNIAWHFSLSAFEKAVQTVDCHFTNVRLHILNIFSLYCITEYLTILMMYLMIIILHLSSLSAATLVRHAWDCIHLRGGDAEEDGEEHGRHRVREAALRQGVRRRERSRC